MPTPSEDTFTVRTEGVTVIVKNERTGVVSRLEPEAALRMADALVRNAWKAALGRSPEKGEEPVRIDITLWPDGYSVHGHKELRGCSQPLSMPTWPADPRSK